MSEEIKDNKIEETEGEKLFSIEIIGSKGDKFYFSGPESSDGVEREKIIYTLFSHYAYSRIQSMLIEKAKLEQEQKDSEVK